MKFYLLFIGISAVTRSSAYVLLQVRKGDNQSNVDALIHKVIPAGDFQLTNAARKQFANYNPRNKNRNDKRLESIVIAINSGMKPDDNKDSAESNKFIKKLSKFIETKLMSAIPKYRTKLERFHIRPEIVNFKNGKPSLLFEINTKVVMTSIQEMLSSKSTIHFTDAFASNIADKIADTYRYLRQSIKGNGGRKLKDGRPYRV